MKDTELDRIRADLTHQLKISDELDWDYFLETARRAKVAADKEGRNMTEFSGEATEDIELCIEARKQAQAFADMLVVGVKFEGFYAIASACELIKHNEQAKNIFVEHCHQVISSIDFDDNRVITSFELF